MNQTQLFTSQPMTNSLDKAEVKAINNTLFLVNSNQGVQNAKLAASCLITPEVGDTVMIAVLNMECFITAVLEKKSTQHQITIKGDLQFNTQGKATISSQGELNQFSNEKMSLTANTIEQLAVKQTMTNQKFELQTQDGSVAAEQLSVTAKQANTVVERCYHKAQQVMRWVETIETLNIGNWVHNIRGTLSSRAQNQVVTAKGDVKVDGQRIHMG